MLEFSLSVSMLSFYDSRSSAACPEWHHTTSSCSRGEKKNIDNFHTIVVSSLVPRPSRVFQCYMQRIVKSRFFMCNIENMGRPGDEAMCKCNNMPRSAQVSRLPWYFTWNTERLRERGHAEDGKHTLYWGRRTPLLQWRPWQHPSLRTEDGTWPCKDKSVWWASYTGVILWLKSLHKCNLCYIKKGRSIFGGGGGGEFITDRATWHSTYVEHE